VATESSLYPQILALSRGPTRLFRQQSLMSWAGRILSRTHDTITLYKPRAITVGVPGMADIGGLTSVVITADMVGQTIGVAVQIEAKGPKTRIEQEQRDYLAMCVRLGARAGIARSVEEAQRIIGGEL
jgi:hypothetical protein